MQKLPEASRSSGCKGHAQLKCLLLYKNSPDLTLSLSLSVGLQQRGLVAVPVQRVNLLLPLLYSLCVVIVN